MDMIGYVLMSSTNPPKTQTQGMCAVRRHVSECVWLNERDEGGGSGAVGVNEQNDGYLRKWVD